MIRKAITGQDHMFEWNAPSPINGTPSITFKEGQIYSFELKSETDVFYRDLIYITSQTNKNEVYKMPDTYTEYSHDDEYVIL